MWPNNALIDLFKAEIQKAWSFPILEIAVGLIAFTTIANIHVLLNISTQTGLLASFSILISDSFFDSLYSQMLFLSIFCGVLVSLSFARDYEQGFMQTLLSSPVSRSVVFLVKFFAVILPLTILTWVMTTSIVFLNFYSGSSVMVVIEKALWALPVIFIALMFCGGFAAFISLSLKRTIPSVLTVVLAGFSIWYISTVTSDVVGNIANYFILTPFPVPLIALSRVFGRVVTPFISLGDFEYVLPTWVFWVLSVFYALVFLVPVYVYFTRRFEIRE
ncbi:MAG: ABC transporter permease [Nitrososphaerota archaeon]|jgi:ABC-type transport system involved in multi-copper enzyme maturation permease subunit|nr:ABC transporter permease [Nitrososphaerota archaeon]